MIQIKNKAACYGCAACEQSCPEHCISMEADNEGFLYPRVDETACISCALCEKVCPMIHPYGERTPLLVLAACNRDETVRKASSSGGIFYSLAVKVIEEGGVVFGARFDNGWQVVIDYADTPEGIRAFMGSKYVQARTGTSFKDAKRFLNSGRKVLYSGTPCQIAGLLHYLRKPYDKLITVDVVCHGAPSPLVWGKYLDEVATAARKIAAVGFRDKRDGWKRFNFRMSYNAEGKAVDLYEYHGRNSYMRAFLSNLILRPSCGSCKAKCGRSLSDISLADYWGVGHYHPEMDDNRGTSLVLVNTDRGRAALKGIRMDSLVSTYQKASAYNVGLKPRTPFHPKRKVFFDRLKNADSVIELIEDTLHPTFKQQLKAVVRKGKYVAINLLKYITSGGVKQEVLISPHPHSRIYSISQQSPCPLAA